MRHQRLLLGFICDDGGSSREGSVLTPTPFQEEIIEHGHVVGVASVDVNANIYLHAGIQSEVDIVNDPVECPPEESTNATTIMEVCHPVKRDLQFGQACWAEQGGKQVELNAVSDRPHSRAAVSRLLDD